MTDSQPQRWPTQFSVLTQSGEMKLHVASWWARFGVVLGVGASADPEALGIQRSILELGLDRFSALEVAHTILCLHLK